MCFYTFVPINEWVKVKERKDWETKKNIKKITLI